MWLKTKARTNFARAVEHLESRVLLVNGPCYVFERQYLHGCGKWQSRDAASTLAVLEAAKTAAFVRLLCEIASSPAQAPPARHQTPPLTKDEIHGTGGRTPPYAWSATFDRPKPARCRFHENIP